MKFLLREYVCMLGHNIKYISLRKVKRHCSTWLFFRYLKAAVITYLLKTNRLLHRGPLQLLRNTCDMGIPPFAILGTISPCRQIHLGLSSDCLWDDFLGHSLLRSTTHVSLAPSDSALFFSKHFHIYKEMSIYALKSWTQGMNFFNLFYLSENIS